MRIYGLRSTVSSLFFCFGFATKKNDVLGRNPKSWTLRGSNDGINWTVLDTRTDEFFSARTQTRRFELPATVTGSYTHYRIFDGENGDNLFQMAEW